MVWERIDKGSLGRGLYGPAWDTEPRISINKTGITFNRLAASAFSLKHGDRLCVMMDRTERKIAFKSAMTPEEIDLGFTMQGDGKSNGKNDEPSSLHVSARKIIKAFPECVGKDFAIKLNRGQLLMEVDLKISA